MRAKISSIKFVPAYKLADFLAQHYFIGVFRFASLLDYFKHHSTQLDHALNFRE